MITVHFCTEHSSIFIIYSSVSGIWPACQKDGRNFEFCPRVSKNSITAQGSVEPLLSPWEFRGYSSSMPGACKSSTATRGHVVSDDGPLELSISSQANLSPFHSSQCLLECSLCVEGTVGLSTPMHGTIGHFVSSLGPVGSWQSAHRVQQRDPFASDSSESMPSSKENSHSFIWTRESRTYIIFPRAFGNFLICSSELMSFSIFPRRGRTLSVFPGDSGRFYLYTWQSRDFQFFNGGFGNVPI